MFNGLILIAGFCERKSAFKDNNKMKKIEIFILLLGLTLGGIIGFVVGNYNRDKSAEMQRDRLSDYIRIYEDIQEEESPAPKLQEVINDLEEEDNLDPSLGFKK